MSNTGVRIRVTLSALLAALLATGLVVAAPVSAAPGVVVSIGDQSGLERDSVNGSVFMPVYLSEPAPEPVVVAFYTTDGTATAGEDYVRWGTPANPRTITIPTGQLQGQINTFVLTDDQSEPEQTFTVTLASVTGADATIGRAAGTSTIIDADAVSTANPAITVSNPTVIEGDIGQRRAQFQVHLSRPPTTTATISYTSTDDTAIAGVDYTAKLPGTVVLAPGQISKTIDVLVGSNTTIGGDRSFTLNVTVTGGSPVEELDMTGVATIIDDDTNTTTSTTATTAPPADCEAPPAPGVNYSSCDFSGESLSDLDLQGANFTNASVNFTLLRRANLADARFVDAQGEGVEFEGADARRADFTRASFPTALVGFADFTDAVFTDASLAFAFGWYVDAAGADFTGTILDQSFLRYSDFTGADFDDASLFAVSFLDSNLTGASLKGAFLQSARLDRADLTGADLTGADLLFAQLEEADLTGADLTGADLRFTDLTGVIWSDTTCPNGVVQSTPCSP